MFTILGKLHPLVVHLPIGILLLNVGLIFITKNEKYAAAKSILPITLLLGALSAVAACVTGLLLSQDGDYTEVTLDYHKWLGIAVAMMSLAMYFFKQQENRIAGVALALLLSITGHYGGTLTHGGNYLAPSNSPDGGESPRFSGDIQKALIYKDLVAPVLEEKCVSCHNANKQKGKLRLDAPDFIMKGGKNGAVVIEGKAAESELVKRLLLELNDEHHMPPKGKPQPTKQEIELLKWWIAEGCSFDKKVAEVPQSETIKKLFISYQKEEALPARNEFVPATVVEPANNKVLESLKKLGMVALPIEPNSSFLLINFISIPTANDSLVNKLQPTVNQIAWLKLDGTKISNNTLQIIKEMSNLTRLSLNNTAISDLKYLSDLKELRYLSLVGTQVTTENLGALSKLTHLQQLYLFNTHITRSDSAQIQAFLPKTNLDFGDYQVTTLASDTTVFKKK